MSQTIRGRPPLPVEETRRHRVVTFVTMAENEELHRLARAHDVSLSQVCHELIIHGLQHVESVWRDRPDTNN